MHGKRVLVDANLLLLYLIGSFQRSRIEVFKRTSQFSVGEFDLLVRFLAEFRVLVTTPHLLTEVSSLANALPDYLKSAWCDHFAIQAKNFLEVFEPAQKIMQEPSFNPFGLTDAAVQNASVDTLILTDDFRLAGFLRIQGIASINFRDLADTLNV